MKFDSGQSEHKGQCKIVANAYDDTNFDDTTMDQCLDTYLDQGHQRDELSCRPGSQ